MRSQLFLILVMGLALAGWGCGGEGRPTIDEVVPDRPSYALHIQPIFTANCTFSNCHGEVNPQLDLKLTSYQNLMRGSVNGPVVIPGDAENSELVRRIEGRSTPRMPFGREPLSPIQIQTIRRWIDQGARDN